MRLWSIHPKYLDAKGLVALWREALLAKKVLNGKTRGYKHHPQLKRFQEYKKPLSAINSYLYNVYMEAKNRNYNFCKSKIDDDKILIGIIPITEGQVKFEFTHLCRKLKERDKVRYKLLCSEGKKLLDLNPIFYLVPGKIETWEKI